MSGEDESDSSSLQRRGRLRSSTSHTGGSLKIPIGFADDEDDDLGLGDLDVDDLVEVSPGEESGVVKQNQSTSRDRFGTGVTRGPMTFGIKEAKYNRNSHRIEKDKKLAGTALREAPANSDGHVSEESLDEMYENEVKAQLSERATKKAPRTPVWSVFSGNDDGDLSDEDAEPMISFHVKLLLLGDSNVGKSCVLTRYSQNKFDDSLIPTTGVDFKTRFLTLDDGQKAKCQVWDTAGQERFRLISRAYYKGSHGIVLVYDVTDRKSFEHLRDWIDRIRSHADDGIHGCILCNKTDLPEHTHAVTKEEGLKMVDLIPNFKFYETSAKTGKNVILALDALAKCVIEHKVVKPLSSLSTPSPALSEQQPRRHKDRSGAKRSGVGCRQQ